MEDTENKVSFFDPNPKIKEFTQRLNAILSKEDSSISYCHLTKNINDRFSLFIFSHNEEGKYPSASFDFVNNFSRSSEKDSDFYNRYSKSGISESDLNDLFDLFKDFTLNYYESLFFVSSFFEYNPNKDNKLNIAFKFTPNADKNYYLINSKNLQKYYSFVSKEYIKSLIIDKTPSDYNFIPFNGYSCTKFDSLDSAMSQLNTRKDFESYYIIEYYRDIEYYTEYLNKACHLVNKELVEVNLKDII